MSYRRSKKQPYNPFVLHDNSFDAETAMRHAPQIIEVVIRNNFGGYTSNQLQSILHHVAKMGAHKVTDKLCEMYPEESYVKLSRWADWFSFTYVRQKFKTLHNNLQTRTS